MLEKVNTATIDSKDYVCSAMNKVSSPNNMPFAVQEFVNTMSSINNKQLIKDTVTFGGKTKSNKENDIKISNGFLGLGKRKVRGHISGYEVDFKLDSNLFGKVKLTGTVEGKPVEVYLKGGKIKGNMPEEYHSIIPQIATLMYNKKEYDELCDVAMIMSM